MQGKGMLTCSDGVWSGSVNCTIKRCPAQRPPRHGKIIGDILEAGAVLRFECNIGYNLVGSNFSQCLENTSWSHTVPECRIKTCIHPPVIEHGVIDISVNGKTNVYGTSLAVRCDDPFIKSGPARIYCDSKGQWTKPPQCVSSACPSYPGSYGKCVSRTSVAENGSLFFIYCTENSTFAHDRNSGDFASCINKTWDDMSLKCYCDCIVPVSSDAVMVHNLNQNNLLRHGQTLNWSCPVEYTMTPADPLTCNDGSIGTPVCMSPHAPINNSAVVEVNSDNSALVIILPTAGGVIIAGCVVAVVCVKIYRHKRSLSKSRTPQSKHKHNNGDIEDQNTGLITQNGVTIDSLDTTEAPVHNGECFA